MKANNNTKGRKLLSVLSALNTREIKALHNHLQKSVTKDDAKVVQLLELLKPTIKNPEKINWKTIETTIYGDFDETEEKGDPMRNLINRLKRSVEDFLVQHELTRKSDEYHHLLHNALKKEMFLTNITDILSKMRRKELRKI